MSVILKVLKVFKHLFRILFLLFFVFNLLVMMMLVAWQDSPINNSMFMIAHRLSGGSVTQTWVEYNDIAKPVKQAAIASEDAKFVSHQGFDTEGIEAAIAKNKQTGALSAGGSTISQQLAKNLFLTSHRSFIRKGEEALITLMMEAMWDKQQILTAYLNVAEFGNGIYGIEAAAQHYYGKPASELNKEESALLICMLTNPKYYQDNLDSRRLRNKQRIIMRRMNSASLPAPAESQ